MRSAGEYAPAPAVPAAEPRGFTRRPAALVELSERMYRAIFGAGLGVAAAMSAYTLVAFALQPGHVLAHELAISGVLLAGCLAATRWRAAWYAALRRTPTLLVVVGAALAAMCIASGRRDDPIFFAATMILGVNGLVVPLRTLALATAVTVVGFDLPHLLASPPQTSLAVLPLAAIPIVTWLIVNQLARYIIAAYQPTGSIEHPPPTAEPSRSVRGRASRWRSALPRGRRRALLPAARPVDTSERGRRQLTARELQVVLLTAEGLTQAEGAAALGVGIQQFRRHLHRARTKTASHTTAELMAWAIREGLAGAPAATLDEL